MKKISIVSILMALGLFTAPLVMADTAKGMKDAGSHGMHSLEAKGKINLFRTQTKDMEIGKGTDMLDAEVLVTLDSAPDLVFGIRYHEEEPSTAAIVDTLREAFLHDMTVTIQYPKAPGKKNNRINWVQMER